MNGIPRGELGQVALAVLVLFVIFLGCVAGVVGYHVAMYRARPLGQAPGSRSPGPGNRTPRSLFDQGHQDVRDNITNVY